VQRHATPKARCGGYGRRLSESLPDWYTTDDSEEWYKQELRFESGVFMDSSYNGELLALSGAPYLQGADERFDGDTSRTGGNDTLGQSFTMTFQIHMNQEVTAEKRDFPPMEKDWRPDPFMKSPAIHTPDHALTWEELWTRRRSYHEQTVNNNSSGLGMDPPGVNIVSAGDVHLAAWPDFYFGYIFVSKAEAAKQVVAGKWKGGYNMASIDGAERYSYGAYLQYVEHPSMPREWRNHTSLNSTYMGTCTGLSKMPYIRDGRRSIGLEGFIMDINFTKTEGKTCRDRTALAGNGFDIWGHRMIPYTRDYPSYMNESGSTGNIYIPLRAYTNGRVENLLVSGLAMAQSFMVNSAVRMHPEEFANGVGAGGAAAEMALNVVRSTGELVENAVDAVQRRIKRHGPIDWTLPK